MALFSLDLTEFHTKTGFDFKSVIIYLIFPYKRMLKSH